jgi:hypothetical protein
MLPFLDLPIGHLQFEVKFSQFDRKLFIFLGYSPAFCSKPLKLMNRI